MPTESTTADTRSTFRGVPSGIAPYIAILAALVSTYVHLSLAPRVLQFDFVQGVLFILAGLGFICGIAVYLSKYWQREFYPVAIVFALRRSPRFS